MAVLALQNVPGCRYIRFFKWLANIKDKPLYVLYFHSTGIKYETNIALKFILVENQTTSFSTRQAPNKKKYFPKTSVWLSFCHYGGYRTRKGHYWHNILSKVHNMYYTITRVSKKKAAQNFSVCPFPMFAFKVGKYLLGKFLLHLFYDFTEQFNTTSDIDV